MFIKEVTNGLEKFSFKRSPFIAVVVLESIALLNANIWSLLVIVSMYFL